MKKTVLILLSPVVLLILLLVFVPQHFVHSGSEGRVDYSQPIVLTTASVETPPVAETEEAETAPRLIDYALTLMGTPYVWAGETPEGFDCSGFITHVYDEFDVKLPHSSRMQAEEGAQVSRSEAQPGDLVIFTGTNPQVREPGHVGIVISQPGDTIEFVHSSSNGGVKISQVEGSGYEGRFLQVRRVL
ncbi:C40 family peptidase [Pontibacter chinhatensis]|uniref:NlpC/P60 family protein n=1 Tax=Pontibacter chinhatensis TaxID=1436961 RepID=A0A1I2MH47_9BACT|nr:C40 family peptidase [Pontibacter chinhatensis]SFF90793.1 NlpC/P60 family protein [Pontibacter chinhatensis]